MENTYDLTKGKVAKQLLCFFFPMLLTNLLQQVYSFADSAIVDKGLGDNALGAVGNLSSLILLIIGFSTGLTNGFSVIIAQKYGAKQQTALRRAIALSVKLSAILTVILTIAGCLLLKPILLIMQTDKLILRDSLLYGYIIFGGLAATIAYNLCSGILRAFSDSKTPFIAIMVSSALNIALDYILIFLLHTGVEGAAIATVFSQVVSAFICFKKIKKSDMISLTSEDYHNDSAMYLELLKNAVPMACTNSVIAVGCMIVQGYINGVGVSYTSAYSACSKYLNLSILPSITAGASLSAFVSQNYGAGKIDRIRKGVRVCIAISLVSYILLGSVMYFFPKTLAGFMLNEEETIALAVQYLKICGAMLFLVNFLFVFRNSVQGMGYPFIPMCSGIMEMFLRIPVIMLFLSSIGFRTAAYAEAIAWVGALAMNFAAYVIRIRKINREVRL